MFSGKMFDRANKNVYKAFLTDFDRVKEFITGAGVKHEQAVQTLLSFTHLFSADGDFSSMEERFASICCSLFSLKVWTSVPIITSYDYILHV